jgi:hypothetical protein
MVTEMDWAPRKYDSSWGKSTTGVAGGTGFGANFKYIADKEGNVSWMIFTSQELLAQFKDVPGTPGNYTFLNDPEACPWPVYHWFKEYAGETVTKTLTGIQVYGVGETIELALGNSRNIVAAAMYSDGTCETVTAKAEIKVNDTEIASVVKGDLSAKLTAHKTGTTTLTVSYTHEGVVKSQEVTVTVKEINPFPLTNAGFNPSIWEDGTFDEITRTLTKNGNYGFGGWKYPTGLNLSRFSTLTVEIVNEFNNEIEFKLFDKDNYWTEPAVYKFGSSRMVKVNLHDMIDKNGDKIDPSHLYIVGFWVRDKDKPIIIDKITLE